MFPRTLIYIIQISIAHFSALSIHTRRHPVYNQTRDALGSSLFIYVSAPVQKYQATKKSSGGKSIWCAMPQGVRAGVMMRCLGEKALLYNKNKPPQCESASGAHMFVFQGVIYLRVTANSFGSHIESETGSWRVRGVGANQRGRIPG
jgi:hypothetical protein